LNYSGTLLFVSLDVPAVTLTVMVEAKNDPPPALTTDGAQRHLYFRICVPEDVVVAFRREAAFWLSYRDWI